MTTKNLTVYIKKKLDHYSQLCMKFDCNLRSHFFRKVHEKENPL